VSKKNCNVKKAPGSNSWRRRGRASSFKLEEKTKKKCETKRGGRGIVGGSALKKLEGGNNHLGRKLLCL